MVKHAKPLELMYIFIIYIAKKKVLTGTTEALIDTGKDSSHFLFKADK